MYATISPRTDFVIQAILVVTIGAAALLSIPVASSADEASTASPTTAPADGAPTAVVPPVVVGEWVEGSISPTTYWNTQTGQFAGNARGMAQYFIFNADGTFKQYIYIEIRMYNMVTQVWTQMNGTAAFADGTLTLTPTSGHYKTAGTREVDRDMTADELAEKRTTYNWQIEQKDGHDVLVMPFDDGSAFRLRRAESK